MFSIFLIALIIGTGSSNARYIRTVSDLIQSTDTDFIENPNISLSSNFNASGEGAGNENNDEFKKNSNLKLLPTVTENPTDLVTSLGNSNLAAESDGRQLAETEKVDGIAEVLSSEALPESVTTKTISLESNHGELGDANVEDEIKEIEPVTEEDSKHTTIVDIESVSDVGNGDVGKVTETVESRTTAENTNEEVNERVVDGITVADPTFKDDGTSIADSVSPAGSLATDNAKELILQEDTGAAHLADATKIQNVTKVVEVNLNEFPTTVAETLPSKVHTNYATTKTISLESSFDSTVVTPATADPVAQENKNDKLPAEENTQHSPLKLLDVSGPAERTSDTNRTTDTIKSDTTLNLLNITSNKQPTGSIEVKQDSNEPEVMKEIQEPHSSYHPATHKSLPEETKTTESPIEKPQRRVYDIPRPLDVQPSKDAIEDLIEEVIGTLNAPVEVEELIEKEIVDSMRGISVTESWHEIKPVKPLVEFRSPDVYQKAQTSHEKEEEEEDISNEIANSVHEISYLLPSSAEQNKAKIDAQLKNTELKHVVGNDQANQRHVKTTASVTPSRMEQHLELPESDNEVMSADKLSERSEYHETKVNDLSHMPSLIASVSLEEPKVDKVPDLAVRLTESALDKLDDHSVTPTLNADINSAYNPEEPESGIKATSSQPVQKKQHYDRILTFVINYGGDAINADDIFQFVDKIETNTIVTLTDSERQSQAITTDVHSSLVQDNTSINQVEVKDVPHDTENILSETSSINFESLRSTQKITPADTEKTKETALDLTENVNDVTPTDDAEDKQINLEPSVSVKEKGLTEKLRDVSINHSSDINSSPTLYSKVADLPVLDNKADMQTNEAIVLTNQVEAKEKNSPMPAPTRSVEAAEASPISDNYDTSVTAETLHEVVQDQDKTQTRKDSFSQTDLMPAENERLDSLDVNNTSSSTSAFGSVVSDSNDEAVPSNKLEEGNFSPQTEAKSVLSHLSTDATLSTGSVTEKNDSEINSKATKVESSEEDIAFTLPVKEAESSSIESHEHSVENVGAQGPVLTFSMNLGVMTNGNDMSKPMEQSAAEVLSTDSLKENPKQTDISDITPNPTVATDEVKPIDNSGSPIQVNHALRDLPVLVLDSSTSVTTDAKQISHPITTVVVSAQASVTTDQNKNGVHSTIQAVSSEESYEHLYPTVTTTGTTSLDLNLAALQNKVNGIKLQKTSSEEKTILATAVQFENHSFESVENVEDSEEEQRDDFVKSTHSKLSQIVDREAAVDRRFSKNSSPDTKSTQADAENELNLSSASYQMDEEDTYRSQINNFEGLPRSYSFANYPHSSETDNQLMFHGRSMISDDLILPSQHSRPSDFVPTKVEFDTVGLSIENQKLSEGSERAQAALASPDAPKNNLVDAIVEAAELTTEMNRFAVTFRPSLATNDEISVPATESTRDAINSKVVESRFLAINSADQYPQAASINITMTVILSITLLTLTVVLLIFFGIRMRNRHGDLNIEMLEQQGNTPRNARNPV